MTNERRAAEGRRSRTTLGGVIFDLDGTLYYLRALRARLAVRLFESRRLLLHLSGARNALRGIDHGDGEAYARALDEELGRRAGVAPGEALRWYRETFLEALVAILDECAWPRPGLLPLLSRLRAEGVRLAVLSDVGRVEDRLRALGIPPEAFDALVETEEAGALKPLPRTFIELSERWGLEPARVIVIGDRADRDEPAARGAGMHSLIIDNHASRGRTRGHSPDALSMTWSAARTDLLHRAGLE